MQFNPLTRKAVLKDVCLLLVTLAGVFGLLLGLSVLAGCAGHSEGLLSFDRPAPTYLVGTDDRGNVVAVPEDNQPPTAKFTAETKMEADPESGLGQLLDGIVPLVLAALGGTAGYAGVLRPLRRSKERKDSMQQAIAAIPGLILNRGQGGAPVPAPTPAPVAPTIVTIPSAAAPQPAPAWPPYNPYAYPAPNPYAVPYPAHPGPAVYGGFTPMHYPPPSPPGPSVAPTAVPTPSAAPVGFHTEGSYPRS